MRPGSVGWNEAVLLIAAQRNYLIIPAERLCVSLAVPVDNVGQLAWVLPQLNLQLALLVNYRLCRRRQHARALIPVIEVEISTVKLYAWLPALPSLLRSSVCCLGGLTLGFCVVAIYNATQLIFLSAL